MEPCQELVLVLNLMEPLNKRSARGLEYRGSGVQVASIIGDWSRVNLLRGSTRIDGGPRTFAQAWLVGVTVTRPTHNSNVHAVLA